MTTETVLARIGSLIKSDGAPTREEVEAVAEAVVAELGSVEAATTLILIARAMARGSTDGRRTR